MCGTLLWQQNVTSTRRIQTCGNAARARSQPYTAQHNRSQNGQHGILVARGSYRVSSAKAIPYNLIEHILEKG